ncbi:unnamed protein product [Schistosoma margrebowiei]|uniref:diphosphoinositol-pentakisphosphate 1-kinase n=1 Tax=Schistosoma margrebowiei TaxID=48269 RepID=A0A183LDN9_9TREM|nr:unnamed protein product [Schistosoma margrebowiei]
MSCTILFSSYSKGVASPERFVRSRLYFTSESHIHSLLTCLRYGELADIVTDEQWRRAMEYVSSISEINYLAQIVIMIYEDPTVVSFRGIYCITFLILYFVILLVLLNPVVFNIFLEVFIDYGTVMGTFLRQYYAFLHYFYLLYKVYSMECA